MCPPPAVEISTNPARLDREMVHRFLSRESYWALGVSRSTVDRAIEHSLAFGLYVGGEQVGFARAVTDAATFAWVADVFVLPAHRGRGLGRRLIEEVLAHPHLRAARNVLLATDDAHGLYERLGFGPLERPERYLTRRTSGHEPFDPTDAG
jgi:GNAT superfamily N-acetyltransferase